MNRIPLIDLSPLAGSNADRRAVAQQIRDACRDVGFFYITNHGVDEELQERLERLSRAFFIQDLETKLKIRMALGGRAWRGYFPLGEELTSGLPDQKEGLYFGAELSPTHPAVRAEVPLHGPNLFPASPPELRETVLEYLSVMTRLGHRLMELIALSLDLPESFFAERYTGAPLILFRIFNYPASTQADSWGAGEHTDYGLLTILKQDSAGGLEVKTRSGWIEAPPIPGSFVCNIGDMLDRLTGGLYRSTPHRVRNNSGRDRLSFPFFFDPNFDARISPVAPGAAVDDDAAERWDKTSVHKFNGTYGEYLLGKVARVFPQLHAGDLSSLQMNEEWKK